jgi:hypothetical protein
MVISDCLFKDCDVDASIFGKDDYGAVSEHGNDLIFSFSLGNSASVSELGGADAAVLPHCDQCPS